MSQLGLDRRRFLRAAGLGASAVAVPRVLSAAPGKKPNILFIQTDSWDGRVLGSMGHPAMGRATSNLDALARRGVLFRNAYTNNPICCPCRASMFSGLWTHHCEGWNNYKGLSKDDRTFLDSLRDGGYQVQTVGKTDFLSGGHSVRARVSAWTRSANIDRPQYYQGPPRIVPQAASAHDKDWKLVDKSVQWLKEHGRASGQPFFLYLGTAIPHPAFVTTPKYVAMLEEAGITIPPADKQDHPSMRYQRAVKNWTHGFSDEMVRMVRRVYYAMCAEADAMIGRVLEALDELGLADSTYVIATSDHGENAMEHRQWYKMNMYESSARIPLIIAGPGVQKRTRVETPVSLVDMYPTLMEMGGLATPEGLDGHSLVSQLTDRPGERPDWVLSEYHDTTLNTGTFMLRQGDWKYVAYVGYEPQLFNLKDDPDEIDNLASRRPDVVRRMDAQLRKIVDYQAVDAKVKAYDRASFGQWRNETKAKGTYEKEMSVIFSGNDKVPANEIVPWSQADEAKIEAWLAEG